MSESRVINQPNASPPPRARGWEGVSALWEFIGADSSRGLYSLVRVLRYDKVKQENYPIKAFWTDRPLSVINPDKVYFFSPALRRFNSIKVSCSRVIWLDIDYYDNELNYHVPPSMVVSTGHGFHIYWRLNEFIYPEEIKTLLDRLLVIYPYADKLVCDPTRLMRLPESYNQKFDPPFKVSVIHFDKNSYTPRVVYG